MKKHRKILSPCSVQDRMRLRRTISEYNLVIISACKFFEKKKNRMSPWINISCKAHDYVSKDVPAKVLDDKLFTRTIKSIHAVFYNKEKRERQYLDWDLPMVLHHGSFEFRMTPSHKIKAHVRVNNIWLPLLIDPRMVRDIQNKNIHIHKILINELQYSEERLENLRIKYSWVRDIIYDNMIIEITMQCK